MRQFGFLPSQLAGSIAPPGGGWPFGLDGALNITTGQTVRLAAGSIKDYSSIDIDAGGVLSIESNFAASRASTTLDTTAVSSLFGLFYAAQTFLAPFDGDLTTASFKFRRLGPGTGNVSAVFFNTSSGLPVTLGSGSAMDQVAQSGPIAASAISNTTSTWYTFTFSGVPLVAGTTYAVALYLDVSAQAANVELMVQRNSLNPYADGAAYTFDGANWTALVSANTDMLFSFSTSSSPWTIIGCQGNCIVDGTITAKTGEHTGGTFTATAPDSIPLSYTIVQSAGGAGGGFDNIGTVNDRFGGSQLLGNGGGGAGSQAGSGPYTAPSGTAFNGGDGGLPNSGGNAGGFGAAIYGTTGSIGTSDSPGVNAINSTGGGGGSRGRHGQGLYLRVAGTFSGVGIIDVRGQDGGAGGQGGGTFGAGTIASGGGGGAGGSGGYLTLYTTAPTYSGNIYTNAGSGGAGGARSAGAGGGTGTGSAGTAGTAGTLDTI